MDQPDEAIREMLGLSQRADREHPDTLAGLLTTAYLSPDVVDRWPKEVGLPGLDRKQRMGAAQVPVLAHMLRRSLMESDLIKAAEAHARK